MLTSAGDGACQIDGKFDFIEGEETNSWNEVLDHCNGLVLFLESRHGKVLHVCTPTTGWSLRMPPYPGAAWGRRALLVFEPSVSPEYKVLLSPEDPGWKQVENNNVCHRMEWPPSAWAMWHEYLSSTGRWAEKMFV